MAFNKPDSSSTTDMTNTVSNFESTPANTSITEYINRWSTWYGYYKETAGYSSLVDKKALWCVGKGYEADDKTTKILDNIRGFGKDTFNTIMANAVRVYTVGGDFYAEIIKNSRGKLINLKPLNPGQWKVKANDKGIVKEYEQVSQEIPQGDSAKGSTNRLKRYRPEQIFHLAWNRTADDIHGVGATEKLQDLLDMYNEAVDDQRIVFHRYVKPLLVFKVDTDDQSEIATFKGKVDQSVKNGENMIVPKDVVDAIENISTPTSSTLNPLPWIEYLENEFVKMEGVPNVVNAVDSGSSEAEAKIIYLAWQQIVEWNQLFLEEQIKAQLGLDVEFNFPASIAPELMQDQKQRGEKDNTAAMNTAGEQD